MTAKPRVQHVYTYIVHVGPQNFGTPPFCHAILTVRHAISIYNSRNKKRQFRDMTTRKKSYEMSRLVPGLGHVYGSTKSWARMMSEHTVTAVPGQWKQLWPSCNKRSCLDLSQYEKTNGQEERPMAVWCWNGSRPCRPLFPTSLDVSKWLVAAIGLEQPL